MMCLSRSSSNKIWHWENLMNVKDPGHAGFAPVTMSDVLRDTRHTEDAVLPCDIRILHSVRIQFINDM